VASTAGRSFRLFAALRMSALAILPAAVAALSPAQQELAQARQSTPNLDRGAELFRVCAGCHGASGGGTADGMVPRIAGQHASVLEKQLVDYRYDRRWDLRMEQIAGRHHLPDAQSIADVAQYVTQLPGGAPNGEGDGQLLEHGAQTYAALCRGCHGEAGQGDAQRVIPRIAGQNYEYLRRQIYDAVDGRRPNFSPAHIRLFARLDHEDIQAVADYASRLRGSVAGSQGDAPHR
jgi:cytochrome c553